MKKTFLIGWKDLRLVFRDRAALILMLAAPFVLTLGLGFVTGAFSGGSSSGISEIPVALVNQDEGELGGELVKVFQSADLADLLDPSVETDPAAARRLVDNDKIATVVIIPAGFTASVIPEATTGLTHDAVQIEVYSNPNWPTSSGVVRSIVAQFISRVEEGRAAGAVTVTQLIQAGLIGPQHAAQVGAQVAASLREGSQGASNIVIKGVTPESEPVDFNVMAYMAPGMAMVFLMFTVTNGGRTLLIEKHQGTLPRLLIAPVSSAQVLAGKMFGIFLTGVLQMLILIVASSLLFQLQWGDWLAIVALVLAAVFGATGWGMVITALVKTPGQMASLGSAVMLIFGILGGSFFSLDMLPEWFRALSKITPNAWGIEGFTRLGVGGTLADILPTIGGLLAMGVLLFAVSVYLFNRKGILRS